MLLGLLLACGSAALLRAAPPVTFEFPLPAGGATPFVREVWAEVASPSGQVSRRPAYFAGDGRFAVRVRAEELGEYRLRRVYETTRDGAVEHAVSERDALRRVERLATLPPVRRDTAGARDRLVRADGSAYVPVGFNLAWSTEPDAGAQYRRWFGAMREHGLNWTRVWMCHWAYQNLDWLPPERGESPPPGFLDLRVAARWDEIIAAAEENGVYVQLVLQHHGQYSQKVNPNWGENPWNAARGGFLREPGEFFTSPIARDLTRLKYRYIVARWGYSPAILAWELFNEVHWVDPIHVAKDERTVAAWHDEMAAFLRAQDTYGHLVTTSHDELDSGAYRAMDFLQPHLYAANLPAVVRELPPGLPGERRVVFYGEFGFDRDRVPAADVAAGVLHVPPVWPSLLGTADAPAQPWLGDQVISSGRVAELGAVARFIAASGFAARWGQSQPFAPSVETTERMPLVVPGAQAWQRWGNASAPLEVRAGAPHPETFARSPRFFAARQAGDAHPFADRSVLRVEFPAAQPAELSIESVAAEGGVVEVRVDGQAVARAEWAPGAKDLPSAEHPKRIAFTVPDGPRTLEIAQVARDGWFEVAAVRFPGAETSALAAVGRRSRDFVAVWVWDPRHVFSRATPPAVRGNVRLSDLPAGEWQLRRWDPRTGREVATLPLTTTGSDTLVALEVTGQALFTLERGAAGAR